MKQTIINNIMQNIIDNNEYYDEIECQDMCEEALETLNKFEDYSINRIKFEVENYMDLFVRDYTILSKLVNLDKIENELKSKLLKYTTESKLNKFKKSCMKRYLIKNEIKNFELN